MIVYWQNTSRHVFTTMKTGLKEGKGKGSHRCISLRKNVKAKHLFILHVLIKLACIQCFVFCIIINETKVFFMLHSVIMTEIYFVKIVSAIYDKLIYEYLWDQSQERVGLSNLYLVKILKSILASNQWIQYIKTLSLNIS